MGQGHKRQLATSENQPGSVGALIDYISDAASTYNIRDNSGTVKAPSLTPDNDDKPLTLHRWERYIGYWAWLVVLTFGAVAGIAVASIASWFITP